MITGFNTDIEHEGVVYHVQTEDKGLETPLILSLVYTGGAILAAKRSPYEDLIAAGFDEGVLSERLKRQHRLICAAIKAGRVEELKQMGGATARLIAPPAAQAIINSVAREMDSVTSNKQTSTSSTEPPPLSEPPAFDPEVTLQTPAPVPSVVWNEPYLSDASRHETPPPQQEEPELEEGLHVSLMGEREFSSGDSLSLGVLVSHKSSREDRPLSGIPVSVKVLGTAFRPVIVSVKTQKDGVAMIALEIPRFSSGRAAILVRAVRGGESVEIRRVVTPQS